jgi:hypothetical protein
MIGRRVYPDIEKGFDWKPGDYGKWKDVWLLCLPTGIMGTIDNRWNIIEYDDGTITVYPSIQTTSPNDPEKNWHGFLDKGIWRAI